MNTVAMSAVTKGTVAMFAVRKVVTEYCSHVWSHKGLLQDTVAKVCSQKGLSLNSGHVCSQKGLSLNTMAIFAVTKGCH